MTNETNPKKSSHWIPLRTAIWRIFLSTLIISGSSFAGLLYYFSLKELRKQDDKYRIIALVQTCPNKECLKTVYLAELLNLSVDYPTNLYQFNTQEARGKLLASPVIKEAAVKKISPGTIYVDYTLYQPIAFLGDYTNTALDTEGYAFPFKPFFTPKKLPKIFVGDMNEIGLSLWGRKIQGATAELALSLLPMVNKLCEEQGMYLLILDVSKAYAPSYGSRQVVMIFEEHEEKMVNGQNQLWTYSQIVRFSTENIPYQLSNYLTLRTYMRKNKIEELTKNRVIDMRIPQLAFITNEKA